MVNMKLVRTVNFNAFVGFRGISLKQGCSRADYKDSHKIKLLLFARKHSALLRSVESVSRKMYCKPLV